MRGTINRRSMLTMAGIGISGGLQYLSPIRAQKESMNNAPADGSVTREPHEMQYVNLLDNTLVAYAMPGPILFTGEILAYAGATIEVVYDARLLTPSSDTAIVSTTNKSHTLLFDVANASNKGTLRLQIPPTPTSVGQWSDGNATLLFPFDLHTEPDLRPDDQIVLSSVDVTMPEGSKSAVGLDATSDTSARRPGAVNASQVPWSADLSVIWASDTPPTELSVAAYARQVRLFSAGPGPVPAGTRVVATSSRAVVNDLMLASVTPPSFQYDATFTKESTKNVFTIILGEALPVGAYMDMAMNADIASGVNAKPNLQQMDAAMVYVDAPVPSGQRPDSGVTATSVN